MRSFIIVMAVYFVPAAALLTFAYVMERWITKQLNKPTRR